MGVPPPKDSADFEITGAPSEKLSEAVVDNTGNVSLREEWEFSKVYIPSQTEPGKVDIWIFGTWVGGPGFRLWLLRSEQKN